MALNHTKLLKDLIDGHDTILTELRGNAADAAAKITAIANDKNYTDEYKRPKIAELKQAALDRMESRLTEAQQDIADVQKKLAADLYPAVDVQERQYHAIRAGQAVQARKTIRELTDLYESEAVQSDYALKAEIEQAVKLRSLSPDEAGVWESTVKHHRPAPIKAAEQWGEKWKDADAWARTLTTEAVDVRNRAGVISTRHSPTGFDALKRDLQNAGARVLAELTGTSSDPTAEAMAAAMAAAGTPA